MAEDIERLRGMLESSILEQMDDEDFTQILTKLKQEYGFIADIYRNQRIEFESNLRSYKLLGLIDFIDNNIKISLIESWPEDREIMTLSNPFMSKKALFEYLDMMLHDLRETGETIRELTGV